VKLLAVAVAGRGLVDPEAPVFGAGDDALLRGRAAFETTRVYGGRPFRLDAHLERLAASAASLGLPAPDAAVAAELADEALAAAAGAAAGDWHSTGTRLAPDWHPEDAGLRLYWTGVTLVATVAPVPADLEQLRARGLRLASLPLGVSLDPPAWLLAGVKSTSYAVNMAAEAEARRRGADDAVFVAGDGIVLEAPISNVWWRRDDVLYTPSLDLGVLAGVTRATVLELAPAAGFRVEEGRYPLADLRGADEAFTSSSIRELLPVVELDGTPVPRGEAAATLQTALRLRCEA
jgi:4-amino-4-deoxychorismate lyase